MRAAARILVALSCSCAALPPDQDVWGHAMAQTHCDEADRLLQRGNRDEARQEASRALALARAADLPALRARALRLLGLAEGSPEPVERSLALARRLGDRQAEQRALLALADLHLEAGRADQARDLALDVLTALRGEVQAPSRAAAAARAHHLLAARARGAGDGPGATARERQAALALSLMPDGEAPALRMAVARGLGDDLAAQGKPGPAFEQHARAAALAAGLLQRREELGGRMAMVADLAAMERWSDCADHLLRSARVAVQLEDAPLTLRLTRQLFQVFQRAGLQDTLRARKLRAWYATATTDPLALDRFPGGGAVE